MHSCRAALSALLNLLCTWSWPVGRFCFIWVILDGKWPKRPMNQTGPDQNGPQIFGMTKTAHSKTKTAHSHIQNSPPPSRKRPMTHRPRKLWKSWTVGARRGGWVYGRGLTPPQFLGSWCITPIFLKIYVHICAIWYILGHQVIKSETENRRNLPSPAFSTV